VPERRPPLAPRHLSAAARRLWRDVLDEYHLEPHHLPVLQAACDSLDRMSQAQAAIKREGAFVTGRYGAKAHPAIAVERDSRLAMLRAIRELGLDLEPPPDSRPPSRWRGR
jgi:P27 family predicted phage terminase small subunit